MGIVRKQSTYSTVFIYIGFAVGAFNTLFLLGKHFVPIEVAGLIGLMNSVSITFAAFASLGSLNALYKFSPFYRDYLPANKNDLPFLIVCTNAIGCILFVIFSIVFKSFIALKLGHNSALFVTYYHLLIPFTLVYSCYLLLEGFCWTIKKTIITNISRELISRVTNTIVILLYAFHLVSEKTFLFLFSLSYLPSAVVLLYAILKDGSIKIINTISVATKRLYDKILIFVAYHFSGMLINIIPPAIDDVMIAGLQTDGLQNVRVYTIAVYLISVMDVPFRSMAGIATTLISEAWKNKDTPKIEELYKKTSLTLLVFGMGIFSVISLNIYNLIELLGNEYKLLAILFLIKGIAKLIDLGSGMNYQILLLSKFWRFDFYTSALFIGVNILLDFFLIKRFGMIGAAYGSSLALVFYNLIRFFFIWRLFKLQPFTTKTLYAILLGAVSFGIAYLLPHVKNVFLDTALRSAVFCLLYFPAIIYFKISEDMNAIYSMAINKFLRKK